MALDKVVEVEEVVDVNEERDQAEAQAAFNEVADEGEAGTDAGTEPKQAQQPKPKPAARAPAKAAVKIEADPWEGVALKVREHIESQAGTIKQLSDSFKRTEGSVRFLQSAVDTAKSVSKAAGAGFGINAEAMKEFRAEFGDDLANHLSKIFVATQEAKSAAAEQGNPFDADAFFRDRIQPSFHTAIEGAKSEARELARLDAKHEEWEEIIHTPEFSAWAFEGGPTKGERDHAATLTDPAQAEAAQNAQIRKYPIWWAEKGVFMDSPKAADAAKLLDNYVAYAATGSKNRSRTEQNRTRLEGNVRPQGTPQAAHQSVSDREAAEAAFEAQFDT